MRLQFYIPVLLLSKLTGGTSCGSTTITAQSDADALNTGCPTVTGDVILATNIVGNIQLDGVEVIDGNLANGVCAGSCGSLASVSSSTLASVSQNFSLIGLSGLANMSFEQLQTVGGQFNLDSLPNLENLSIPVLSSVGQFHLGNAPNLVTMNLSQLYNITGQQPSIEVISVGLQFFQSLNVNSVLDSFILRDTPNSEGFSMDIPQIDYLEIQPGNGSHETRKPFSFSTTTQSSLGSVSRVGTLNMSNCTEFTASSTLYDNMILSQNSFTYLDLSQTTILNNLSILGNGDLSELLLPTNMSMQNIEIEGNLVQGPKLSSGLVGWPWGIQKINSMVLIGEFHASDFNSSNLTLIEVSSSFSLYSTYNIFDCTYLNKLRTEGYFQGNYSCQGNTVAAGHVRTTASSSSFSLATPLSSVVAALILGIFSAIL